MNNEMMARKFSVFKKTGIRVHIDCYNGDFYNGSVFDIGEDYVIIDDRKLGWTPIMFCEIKGQPQKMKESKDE